MLLLGYDVGSSSIKASIIDAEKGERIGFALSPGRELPINAPRPGWAEQDPVVWWRHLKKATRTLLSENSLDPKRIQAIGISYQMHGLVVVDRNRKVLRPAIIWCDGRAVEVGKKAFEELGEEFCLAHYLNSPGNFTASKLRWVKEHEPNVYAKMHKFMLPGDYITMKLTGNITTTVSGLSEGILWDYQEKETAYRLLEYYDIDASLVPPAVTNFSEQGRVTAEAASELGLEAGTGIFYRAGDQPNNALSLNVLAPGEAAATAGTSGVIYGVTDRPLYDKHARVNTFVHVNYGEEQERYGVLLCINGTGIQYRWLKDTLLNNSLAYDAMNKLASEVEVGSAGVLVMPFGNGPERSLENKNIGARIEGIDFNRHSQAHVIRATQEGIAFAMNYGLQIMQEMGVPLSTIRVPGDNLFLSPVFAEAFANVTGIEVELYDTTGAQGAAIGAGIGAGVFDDREEAFRSLEKAETVIPQKELKRKYDEAYNRWKNELEEILNTK
ncbi:MAG: FGGY family carbohydrate kinase [Balneolaceae bacterium]|jgi:xylulokinase